MIGGKICSNEGAEGSNLNTKPGSKCMCWPKVNLHMGFQVPSSQLLCARSPRNWKAVSAVVLTAQPCTFCSFPGKASQTPQIWLRLQGFCNSAFTGSVLLQLCWRWDYIPRSGLGGMLWVTPAWQTGKCQLRQEKSKRHRRTVFIWHSHCSS